MDCPERCLIKVRATDALILHPLRLMGEKLRFEWVARSIRVKEDGEREMVSNACPSCRPLTFPNQEHDNSRQWRDKSQSGQWRIGDVTGEMAVGWSWC